MTNPPPSPVDVTAELGRDANLANRVYRTAAGRIIKIRTGEVTPSPIFGQRLFKLTGSDCDESGSAHPLGDGHRIAPEHQVILTASRDLETELEKHRLAYVIETEARAAAYEAPRPVGVVEIPHVDTLTSPRKA